MSSKLCLRKLDAGVVEIRIDVTSPTRGVAILDATVGAEPLLAPLHWRTGDWTKPPLDMSLSPDGTPQSLQVVFQDEAVSLVSRDHAFAAEAGVPKFEMTNWPDSRYIDAEEDLRTTRLESGHLLVSIGSSEPSRRIAVGSALEIGLGSGGELVELLVGPLTPEQWLTIRQACS